MSDGKIAQYVEYALGEIVLVVIGILIALQINNWNQTSINLKNERIYLLGLKEEFQTSKLKLDELMLVNQKNYNNALKILQFIGSKNVLPGEAEFSSLMYDTFAEDISYNPNNSLLFEMISSGNLKNLTNTELRKQLTNWISTLEDISKQEIELGNQRKTVLDMFQSSKYSIRTVLKYSGTNNDLRLTNHAISNLGLLKSVEFENNLLMFILSCKATEKAHYLPLQQDLDLILKLLS
ncbi:MAG: DUF6090 family protein [Spirosomataceae bacterium]